MSLIPVYLGLGSNVERERHLHAGLDALAGFLHDLRCSPVFESEPVGIKSGPFFNLVVSARTDLPLAELSLRLKHIEADNGRYAPERKGLPLDIDVLFYGDLVGDFDGLVLPRAEVLKNAFVLWPLSSWRRTWSIRSPASRWAISGARRGSSRSSGRRHSNGVARR